MTPEEKREYDKKYRQEHQAEIKEQKRGYYQERKVEEKEYGKKYRQEHKTEIKENNRIGFMSPFFMDLINNADNI